MLTFKELKARLLKDKEFRKCYEEKKPLYDFINDLLTLRYEKGWTQKDLAKATNLPVRIINKIETGKCDLRYSTMKKLADALGGRLFITIQGDNLVRLSEKVRTLLDEIEDYTKEPSD